MRGKHGALCAHIQKMIDERSAENDLDYHHAWSRVAAELLGYDEESVEFLDNKDGGVDFYWAGNTVYEIFQCKMHDLIEAGDIDAESAFSADGVSDLERACTFLLGGKASPSIDPRMTRLRARIASDLALEPPAEKGTDDERRITIGFNLVILGTKLVPAATAAVTNFRGRLRKLNAEHPGLHTHFEFIHLDQLASEFSPADSVAVSVEPIRLHVALDQLKLKEPADAEIKTNDFVTFYSPAVDLVRAADKSGPALFDANVRYELKKSQVNEDIRHSAMHPKTMRVFHLYNNGVTIAARGWSYKDGGRIVEIREPSIINGCQTVRSLVSASKELEDERPQEDYAANAFELQCSVLVRLILKSAVNIEDVVRAANTQNPMEPRNLLGNRSEQMQLERDVEAWGWFYERKDGAQDALREMKRSSLGSSIAVFKAKGGKIRACDNREIARAWLSFIGNSDGGKNRSNRHFLEERQDGLYRKIFLSTPTRHRDIALLEEDKDDCFADGRPPAAWMLLAHHLLSIIKRTLPQAPRIRGEVRRRLAEQGTPPSIAAVNQVILADEKLRLQFALSMLDHVVLEITGFAYARALGSQWLAAGPAKQALNIGVVGEYHSTGKVPESLRLGEILDLTSDVLSQDPALLAIRLAVKGVEATLERPEYKESFKSSERKSRYLQSDALLRQYCRSVDLYNKYFAAPGHFEDWWQGGAPLQAIEKALR